MFPPGERLPEIRHVVPGGQFGSICAMSAIGGVEAGAGVAFFLKNLAKV